MYCHNSLRTLVLLYIEHASETIAELQVTELKPEWLVDIAPHYYQLKDVEDCMPSLSLSLSLKQVGY